MGRYWCLFLEEPAFISSSGCSYVHLFDLRRADGVFVLVGQMLFELHFSNIHWFVTYIA